MKRTLKNFTYFLIALSLAASKDLSAQALANNNNNTGCNATLDQHALSQGQVIFITGSCSSGKSSMAKIIAEKLDAESFAFDEYVMPIVLKRFIQKHYGKFLAFFYQRLGHA